MYQAPLDKEAGFAASETSTPHRLLLLFAVRQATESIDTDHGRSQYVPLYHLVTLGFTRLRTPHSPKSNNSSDTHCPIYHTPARRASLSPAAHAAESSHISLV
jgi:hypothetical protein